MRWPSVRLGEVCRVIPGFAFKSADFTTQGIPVVKIANITDNCTLDLTDVEHWPDELFNEKLSKFLLQDRDILLAMTGATAGKMGRVRSDQLLLLNQRVAKIEPFEADPDFIWFSLSSPKYRERFYNLAGGAAQPNMSSGQIEAVEILLPPRPTQERIGSILSAYDDLITNNQRRMALLEEAARQLYREWFVRLRFPGHEHTRITNGVPEGWERKRLGERAYITMGQSPESAYYNEHGEGLPFHQGVADFGDRFVNHQVYCTALNRIAEAGDILCSVRAPVGRLNVTLDRIVIGRGLAALRSKTANQSFLFQQLRAYFFKEDLIGAGAIFASVTKKEFESQELIDPPDQLKRAFEDIVVPCDEQLRVLHLQK